MIMKLTAEQKSQIAQWAAEGATLNDIQARMRTEMGISITYLEARLLLLDESISLKEKEKPREQPAAPDPAEKAPGAQAAPEGETGDEWADEDFGASEDATAGGGKVSVTVDQIAIPGTMISGKATFSDGKTASWYLDQFGQLGMRAPEKGYQPPQADIPVFQRELQRVLG